jgi:hypothetical protein
MFWRFLQLHALPIQFSPDAQDDRASDRSSHGFLLQSFQGETLIRRGILFSVSNY